MTGLNYLSFLLGFLSNDRAMSEPLAIARQYQDITEVFRARRIELGLSYAFIDAAAGFSEGHAEAMLGPSAKKGWGQATFFMLCDVLAVEFHAHVDIEAAKRMEQKWEQRRAAYVRESARISQKLLKLAKPLILREMGRIGGLKSASQPSARLRNKKGGKSRMRKITKAQRSALSKVANTTRWAKQRGTLLTGM
jgi:hypothetical protein